MRRGSIAGNMAAVTMRVAPRLAGGGPPSWRSSTCFLDRFPLVQLSSGQGFPHGFAKLCTTDGCMVCWGDKEVWQETQVLISLRWRWLCRQHRPGGAGMGQEEGRGKQGQLVISWLVIVGDSIRSCAWSAEADLVCCLFSIIEYF